MLIHKSITGTLNIGQGKGNPLSTFTLSWREDKVDILVSATCRHVWVSLDIESVSKLKEALEEILKNK